MGGKNKIDNSQPLLQKTASSVVSEFSGLASIKPMAKYLSGARCVLRMNGKIIGFAFAISWQVVTDAMEINTIDDYLPYELAPSRITVTGTISGFRIPTSGPGSMLLQPDVLNFLHQRYVEIEVKDEQTDTLIFLTKKAMITSRSESIKSDSLAEMTLNFKAIGFADDRVPVIFDGIGDPVDPTNSAPVKGLWNNVKNFRL